MESVTVVGLVLKRFGGLTALARALGHRNPTTVQGWKETGAIPPKHWPMIEKAAFERGFLDMTARWLGEMHAQQETRRSNRAEDAKKKIEAAAPA